MMPVPRTTKNPMKLKSKMERGADSIAKLLRRLNRGEAVRSHERLMRQKKESEQRLRSRATPGVAFQPVPSTEGMTKKTNTFSKNPRPGRKKPGRFYKEK